MSPFTTHPVFSPNWPFRRRDSRKYNFNHYLDRVKNSDFLSFFLCFVEHASKHNLVHISDFLQYVQTARRGWDKKTVIFYMDFLPSLSSVLRCMIQICKTTTFKTLLGILAENIASYLLTIHCIDYSSIDHNLSQYSYKAAL